MTKTKQAIDFFVSKGWTKSQACGIVANLEKESNLNSSAVGDSGAAYGIAQWHRDRQDDFHAIFKKSIKGSTLLEQLEFVNHELHNKEKSAGNKLKQCNTANDAGSCISRYYERPADTANECKKRGDHARTLFTTII
jgi:hypothetical protein